MMKIAKPPERFSRLPAAVPIRKPISVYDRNPQPNLWEAMICVVIGTSLIAMFAIVAFTTVDSLATDVRDFSTFDLFRIFHHP